MRSLLRTVVYAVLYICVLFVVALVADRITLLQQLDRYFNTHQQPYLIVTIAITAVGFILFMGFGIIGLIRSGTPINENDAEQTVVRRSGLSMTISHGRAFGWQYREVHSIAEIKDILRSSQWLRDAGWLVYLARMAGALLLFGGLLCVAFVIGSPAIKLLVGVALLYALARLLWAFSRA